MAGDRPEFPWDGIGLPVPVVPVGSSFEGFLDLRWEELAAEKARVRFELRDALRQPLGLLHGGIYSSVAETVASVATARAVIGTGGSASGLSNSAHFLRPILAGSVRVEARRRYHDDREWLWSNEFFDERGRLCSMVDVWIAVREPRQ